MNDEAVYRTAPATLGLLIIIEIHVCKILTIFNELARGLFSLEVAMSVCGCVCLIARNRNRLRPNGSNFSLL